MMILIKSSSKEDVLKVVDDIDTVDDFANIDLGELNSLSLSDLNMDSMDWTIGEPLCFDEETGTLLIEYSNDALTWFKSNIEMLAEYGVSAEDMKAFCENQSQTLFCLDTF
jgi:hypothetical protein